MKILLLANKIPYPPKDGGSIATYAMAKGFSMNRAEVIVLAMNTRKHFFDISQMPESVKQIISFKVVNVPAGITPGAALYNLLFSKTAYNASRFISEDFEKELSSLLKNNTIDVVQLEGLYLAPYIPSIRRYSNALISLRAHNIEHEIWNRVAIQEKNILKKMYINNLAKRIKKMETECLNKYDALVPITERDKAEFKRLGNIKPVHVSPTGIFLETHIPERKAIRFPSLFYIGALDWAPNQEGLTWFLDKVWIIIHAKYPAIKFFVAGRNAPNWLVSRFKQPDIEYLGEVDDAYSFMNSGAVMIVPLLSGSGMRVKIVEGMALGKTIVATSIGTEGIATKHGVNILIADTPAQFTAEIEKVLNDRALFDQIGMNAMDFVKKEYDNNMITQKLLEFYSKEIAAVH